MSRNYTAAIDYWGFKCPKGGEFYICENAWVEFFGCCDDDPCADGTGICQSGVKPLSFDPDNGYEMPLQTCLSSSSSNDYYKRPAKAENAQTYSQIRNQGSDGNVENMRPSPTPSRDEAIMLDIKSQSEPRNLKQADFTTFIFWVWNVVLTLVPMCFIALAIVVVNLDDQLKSNFGQHVLELTKLSPSLYPILFAAVVGRFYKNLARYCLEQSGGVRLAVLEQVFGSQSFATALERVFFVHTHIVLSVIILTTWGLSPLGGQSSSRILGFGNATEVANGTVNYLHPAYQVSSYLAHRSLVATKGSVAALYSSNLLSSLEQKRSPRDMWELPKIPQVTGKMKKVGKTYMVDREALESGDYHYASLLGVKLRGLGSPQEATEHHFTVQTSYIDLDCKLTDEKFDFDTNYWKNKTTEDRKGEGADVRLQAPVPWEEWNELDEPPPLELTYFIRWQNRGEEYGSPTYWSAINCTMQTIWLETDIHCGPRPTSTSCYAYQQRRIKDVQHANHPPRLMRKRFGALQQALGYWPEASGDSGFDGPLATENYIMGELHPYARQDYRDWSDVSRRDFYGVSQRLTTAFNTFWDATLNPLGHTNVSFGALNSSNTAYEDDFNLEPFMNATVGTMTRTFEVYLLAILGLVLEAVIVGPEVLGFASSLTRDNPYIPVPLCNSGLDGAERARALGDLRLRLADVEPREETGYIAVHALQNNKVEKVSAEDSEGQSRADEAPGHINTRPLGRERLYR
ncbi:uncharacterized protein B0J16DRAFT_270954 [Fusarium flagelliforme]|uniref:uncharacterized protein n=1 Tax=Fusarium flagelliforme TaxID=2675880 RepID=UPI001E8EE963|nr:uncharacterized protein B0J16DRAFT_270954 [Fusarium flagelliforme]KAH7182329.1 hypothetical protein B0J16DRAFT_270954 [Fusarium flagelliforme]